MEQSDLSRLRLFINTLPRIKVLSDEWNERYIEDISTYSDYEAAKYVAIKTNRYVNVNDMSIEGYSLEPYESLCDQPTEEDKCHECCSDSDETVSGCKYDPEKCNRFFAENVHNWRELCGYHILFLQGKTPGTPDHQGPWNRESKYIIEPLTRILSAGMLTLDSQPGLMVNDEGIGEYIQKPYLRISGPAGRLHRILIKILFPTGPVTLDNSIIKYVPYGVQYTLFNGYNNYEEDGQDYVNVMLGIETPNMLSGEYTDYIFSNRFFDHIADIVETTG